MPMRARTQKEKDAFWHKIQAQMPAYLYHVMLEHKISEKFSDVEEERMGVRGYHNEKALNFVELYSNEGKRLHAIIEILRRDNGREWAGSAGELVKLLHKEGSEKYANAMSMGRFLNQRIACGTKLVNVKGHRKYVIDTRVHIESEDPLPEVSTEDLQTENQKAEDLLEDEDNYYENA